MKHIQFTSLMVLMTGSLAAADDPPRIKLEPIVRGLERCLWLTHDGTDRVFIVEQPGRVRLMINGELRKEPYLDISDRVRDGGEQGLLCIVFHPKFAENGFCYVNYVRRQPVRQTVIAEIKVDPKADRIEQIDERIIMTIDQPYANHNGGQLLFGPDGMLYIGMGDGGAFYDPQNRAQNMRELLGKILRIDVSPREGYTVPKDNPFVSNPDARPEIWSLGWRNPWRMSFDRQTGLLWAGDVGQDKWEEVDIVEKGGNYGWRIMESFHDHKPVENPPKMINPIKEYGHDLGLSITGGYVYRGKKIPTLAGWYIYGDYSSGRIWGLKYESAKVIGDEQLLHSRAQPSSFGEDAAGELYLVDYNGTVYRIVAGE